MKRTPFFPLLLILALALLAACSASKKAPQASLVGAPERSTAAGAEALRAGAPPPQEKKAEIPNPPGEESDWLSIGRYRFNVKTERPTLPPALLASGQVAVDAAGQGVRPMVFKFGGAVDPDRLEEIEASGVQLVQYQAHHGYLALVASGGEQLLNGASDVVFMDEYHGAYKTDEEVEALLSENKEVTLGVVFFDLASTDQRIADLLSAGARLAHQDIAPTTSQWRTMRYTILEDVPTGQLAALLNAPEVYNAYVWHPPHVDGERAAQIVAGNYTGSPPAPTTGYHAWLATLGAGVDGSGVTICVADTGLDTGNTGTVHVDVRGRVSYSPLCANNQDTDGHGTNTTSIAAGDPRAASGGTGLTDTGGFYWGGGSSPRSSIWFQTAIGSCTYNANANALAQDAVGVGHANIGSHSFTDGLGGGATYNAQCQAWDARVRDADTATVGNQPYAAVFSAGNSGPSAGSLTSPKAAKNIITVGGTENYRANECPATTASCGAVTDIDTVVSFSSRGPTSDSRIKPDVCAPAHTIAGMQSSASSGECDCDGTGSGCCDWSVAGTAPSQYCRYSGTSQACPRIAGASGIVHDWYNTTKGAMPSPAMNKAILINGAVDMKTADIPNSNEGWGRANLTNSLTPGTQSFYKDQSTIITQTGAAGEWSTTMTVSNPSKPVKASLVWTDAPGSVACNPCLVNNLDLSFVTAAKATYLGNNFSGGWSVAGGTADTRNNVECIYLPAGTITGAFTIKVTAAALNGDGVPGSGTSTDQDFALVVMNAIDCVPPAAPTGVTANGNGDNRIDVSWDNTVPDATAYRVYRSLTSGGPYTYVGEVTPPTTTYIDTPVSGQVLFYYIVRTFKTCESADSNEWSAIASGPCTLAPTFAGLTSVTNAENTTCTLNLAWAAATRHCAGPVTYKVYRSSTTPFTPGPANLIASGIAGTTYSDHAVLTNNTLAYYIVRSVDATSGLEDTNTATKSGAPTGPVATGNISDTFEGALSGGGFDVAGWTHSALSGTTPTDWAWSTAQAQSPTHSWFAQDISTTNDKVLVSPEFGVLSATTMSFYHRYTFEGTSSCYDGGTLEYATSPYTTWTVIPDAYFTANGFNGTASTCCSNPIGGKRAWCFSLGSWTQVTLNLGALNGQTIKVRWHEGDDSSQASTGWYVDTVLIQNAGTASVCSSGVAPNPKEVSPAGSPMTCERAFTGSGIDLAYTPGCGTFDNVVYRGVGPISGAIAWNDAFCPMGNTGKASFNPGDPPAGGWYYFVIVGQNATVEGSYGQGTAGERPAAVGGACKLPQNLSGVCP